MGDDLLDAARKVLFAVVGRRNQEFPQLQQLAAFLRYYISADAMVAGRKLPFPDAELAARFTGAAAPSTMRHSGLRPFYFHVAYEEAVMQYGIEYAQPDLDILHRFVPESWVRVIANMIAEGPSVAAARAQVALYRYSKGNVRANRRRSTQQRSQAAVSIVLHQAQGLFKTICGLQSLAPCQHWAHIRKLMLPEMVASHSPGEFVRGSSA